MQQNVSLNLRRSVSESPAHRCSEPSLKVSFTRLLSNAPLVMGTFGCL